MGYLAHVNMFKSMRKVKKNMKSNKKIECVFFVEKGNLCIKAVLKNISTTASEN